MANLITIARFPVLIGVVLLLYTPGPTTRYVAVGLMILLIALDTVDGIVARARKETSLLGSVLDIMADRAVELVMWVCYADLRLVPVAIPILFVLRGTIVDSLRNASVSRGTAPFKSLRGRLGSWLVGSPLMRTSYGLSKLTSFTGLALVHALAAQGADITGVHLVFTITSWVATAFCLLRGLPVILEALPLGSKVRMP
jgi:CDP-diacylglycerol---glycerol-3-phosphate 3-phosphatidyltransferase